MFFFFHIPAKKFCGWLSYLHPKEPKKKKLSKPNKFSEKGSGWIQVGEVD